MKPRDYSVRLRIGYILVSLFLMMEIGDLIYAYVDPLQYALCNVCFIKSLILIIIAITGFVLIYKGMNKEYPENLHSVELGIALLFIVVILDVVVLFNYGGIEGVVKLGGKRIVFWIASKTLISLLGIFFLIHAIHTPGRKKIIAAVLVAIFVIFTVNLIVMYPKWIDFYEEMEDFVEEEEAEEEEYSYSMVEDTGPTVEEILEKYHKEKKPLLVHVIIRCILELIIVLIFFSSFFFHRDDYDKYDDEYHGSRSWRRH